MRILITLLFWITLSSVLQGQDEIPLQNGSFEDIPKMSNQPRDWRDCGFLGETPPDVHPRSDSLSFWDVQQKAQDGRTFLGMVVRDNETYESIAQYLRALLEAGECYEMSIQLCRSMVYRSQSRLTGRMANYNQPAVFRIYGGNSLCSRRELLFETPEISNTDWEEYFIEFKPHVDHSVIIFEAFYKTPILFPYNGNILVDNASSIRKVDCPEEIALNEEPNPRDTKVVEKVQTPANVNARSTQKVKPKVFKAPEILKELDIAKVEKGQTIPIKNLNFEADSASINRQSEKVLNEIFEFMDYYPDVVIEIGGHANLKPKQKYAEQLSLARAQSVVNYLIEKGIDPERLKPVGYGNTKPIIESVNKIANRINQRVEIKILSVEG